MPLLFAKRYTRSQLQASPEQLFVFGDNLQRRGYGGQAREARGEPNAVGIVTKQAPHMGPQAFFTDADLAVWREANQPAFQRLINHRDSNGIIVWPSAGLGTGRARLQQSAPLIWDELQRFLSLLIQGNPYS